MIRKMPNQPRKTKYKNWTKAEKLRLWDHLVETHQLLRNGSGGGGSGGGGVCGPLSLSLSLAPPEKCQAPPRDPALRGNSLALLLALAAPLSSSLPWRRGAGPRVHRRSDTLLLQLPGHDAHGNGGPHSATSIPTATKDGPWRVVCYWHVIGEYPSHQVARWLSAGISITLAAPETRTTHFIQSLAVQFGEVPSNI